MYKDDTIQIVNNKKDNIYNIIKNKNYINYNLNFKKINTDKMINIIKKIK